MDETLFIIKLSCLIVSCRYLVSMDGSFPWKWQNLRILQKMSGRPRSCVTKLQINIIKAHPLLFHVRHMSFVRILDYRDPLPPPPPPHPPPHHHRHRALEGERRGPGIYKRQCNREKTRTWPPGCTQPMARPCRFLHKTTVTSNLFALYVLKFV